MVILIIIILCQLPNIIMYLCDTFQNFPLSVQTLSNFTISVGDTFQYPFKPRSFTRRAHVRGYLGDHETRYVTCEEPVNGRFVVVYQEERGQIQMCEFEVFGNVISGRQLTRDGFFYQYAEFVFGMVLILPKISVCTRLHKMNDPKRLFVTSICFSFGGITGCRNYL